MTREKAKRIRPSESKLSFNTTCSSNATGNKLLALKQCQIVGPVVACAQLWPWLSQEVISGSKLLREGSMMKLGSIEGEELRGAEDLLLVYSWKLCWMLGGYGPEFTNFSTWIKFFYEILCSFKLLYNLIDQKYLSVSSFLDNFSSLNLFPWSKILVCRWEKIILYLSKT